jgi:hypothetical protein
MQAICCGRRAAANCWFLLRLGRLQYFISQFCNTKNLLRPQKKWFKISLKDKKMKQEEPPVFYFRF